MTAPRRQLLFNYANGSDTLASGVGPFPAVTGADFNGCHNNSNAASNVLTFLNSPDLSGVAPGDLINVWLPYAYTRLHIITAVDNTAKTVTLDAALGFAIPSATSAGYAIGGKLKTLDGQNATYREPTMDWQAGWILELEDDQVLQKQVPIPTAGSTALPCVIRGQGGRLVTLEQTANVPVIHLTAYSENAHFQDLKLTNSNGTKTDAVGFKTNGQGVNFVFRRCVFGDATDKLQHGISFGNAICTVNCIDCVFQYCSSYSVYMNGGTNDTPGGSYFVNCRFYNNTSGQIYWNQEKDFHCLFCTFAYASSGTTQIGIYATSNHHHSIVGCAFYDGGVAVSPFNTTGLGSNSILIMNNVFVGQSSYAIYDFYGTTQNPLLVDYNAYYDTAFGNTPSNLDGANDIALTGNPFNDAANGDFTLNNTAGAGAALKAAGFPQALPAE